MKNLKVSFNTAFKKVQGEYPNKPLRWQRLKAVEYMQRGGEPAPKKPAAKKPAAKKPAVPKKPAKPQSNGSEK